MATPPLPAHVVTNELIESAWGNAVVTMLERTTAIRTVSPAGATAAPGGQVQIASIALPQGIWLVHYQVLVTAVNDWKAALRAFVGGAAWSDVYFQGRWDGADANHSIVMHVVADFSAAASGGTVTFNLINNSATPLNTFPDPGNHRLTAIAGRVP